MAVGALVLACLVEAPAPVHASPPPAQVRKAALARAKQGWTYYGQGRYEEALKAFREADSKVHAPTFLLMVARSCEKLGRLLEARSAYQTVVDDRLAADAPAAFAQAQAEAKTELGAIAQRIPTLEIAVTGAGAAAARVTLDGVSVAPLTPVECDPGSHALAAESSGRRALAKNLVLKERARTKVALDLDTGELRDGNQAKGDGAGAAPRPAPAAVDGPAKDVEPPAGRSTAVVIGGLAATAVGATLGLVFAVVSTSKADAQEELLPPACDDPARCPGLDLQEYNRLGHARADLANASVWSFAAAGALGLGTVAYVVLTRAPGSPEASPTSLSVMVGPGGLVVSKRW